jgi:tetratricopeptide (TPR) repeat protein
VAIWQSLLPLYAENRLKPVKRIPIHNSIEMKWRFLERLLTVWLVIGVCTAAKAQHVMQMPTGAAASPSNDPHLTTPIANLGDGGIDAESALPAARIAFDNGVKLDNSFSQEEALRAFMLAEHLDPHCAMCYWGEASSLAPTINYTVPRQAAVRAVEALSHAESITDGLSPKAKGIIAGECQRYVLLDGNWVVDDEAEARATDALAERFPNDDALQVSAANAQMIAAENGSPGSASATDPHLAKAQMRLETVLLRNPTYMPAIHLYLHLTEWQRRPAASLPYARRLAVLAPESGHMLHMVSHIDYHTGDYEGAAQANMAAVAADIDYVEKMQPPGGMDALPMHQHNLLFGLVASLISGDKDLALKFADEMQRSSPPESLAFAESYFAFGRFAPALDVLALKEPTASLARGFYHFARGEALVRDNNSLGLFRRLQSSRGYRKPARSVTLIRQSFLC